MYPVVQTIVIIIIVLLLCLLIPRYLYLELLSKGFYEVLEYKDKLLAMKDKIYLHEKEKWYDMMNKMRITGRKKR